MPAQICSVNVVYISVPTGPIPFAGLTHPDKMFTEFHRILIAFAALILRNRMYTKLKDAEEELLEKPNYMNVPASIRELEKIELVRQADGIYRLDHAVTATQKTILKAFGIDANYVKRKAREISDQLNPKVLTVRI